MPKGIAAKEYDIRIEEDQIYRVFNEAYLPYLNEVKRYEVYYGGAGSGKSHFIAQKLALQMTTMDGRNLVVLRKQAVDCRESAYPNLYNAICDLGLRKFWHIVEHPTMRMVNLVNGNTIIFDGVDDIENIKSIKFKKKPDEELEPGEENLIEGNLTDVWYEEASEEESISPIEELDRRLRDRTKQCRIILSFNPVFVEHWLKGFIDRLEKSRRKNYIVMKSTYKDNKFLPSDYIQMLEDYRLTNPYAYQVYALGNWGVMGDSIFDANQVNKRLEELYAQEDRLVRTVDFAFELREDNRPITDSIAPYDDLYGQTIIYEAPQKGVPYVLAVDTAGDSRLDYYAGQVINNITGNQAAVFHSQNIPHWCVHQVYCLAVYYNFALIAPEINFDRFILEKLKEFEYPYVYQRNKPMDSLNYGYEAKMGFITSAENRPRILNALVLYISKNVHTVNDIDTLHEFLTFTRQVKKRTNGMWMGAANGAHDDLVMSYAIALEARQQQSTEKIPDRRVITGMYFPEQLKSMVRHGELDEDAARDYLKKNKEFFYNLIGDVDEYDFYD